MQTHIHTHTHHEFSMYIALVHTFEKVYHVYEGFVQQFRIKNYCPPYIGLILSLNHEIKRTSNNRPTLSWIRVMDNRKQHSHAKNALIVTNLDTPTSIWIMVMDKGNKIVMAKNDLIVTNLNTPEKHVRTLLRNQLHTINFVF